MIITQANCVHKTTVSAVSQSKVNVKATFHFTGEEGDMKVHIF